MNKALTFLLSSALMTVTPATFAESGLTDEQETRIKQLIRETLVKHPEILEETAKALQEKQQLAETLQLKKRLSENKDALYNDPTSPVIGNKDAPLKIVYFTDYNCPYCKRFDPEILKLSTSFPQVAIIIKPVPYLGEGSKVAAEKTLSIWATKPEQFLKIHQALMDKKTRIDTNAVNTILANNGLKDFNTTKQGQQATQKNYDLARKLNIRGTPATIIGEQIISGAVSADALEHIVRQTLSDKQTL